jgi:hypothetical protein
MAYSLFLELAAPTDVHEIDEISHDWVHSLQGEAKSIGLALSISAVSVSNYDPIECPVCGVCFVPNRLVSIQLPEDQQAAQSFILSCELSSYMASRLCGMGMLVTQNSEIISFHCHHKGVVNSCFSLADQIRAQMPHMDVRLVE